MLKTKTIIPLQPGRKLQVEAILDPKGRCQVTEFLNQLPDRVRLNLLGWMDRLAREGFIPNEDKFKKLEGASGLWEFRHLVGQARILGFFPAKGRRNFVLINGVIKKSQKTPPAEIDRAERLKADYEKD
jgi:phage-related protein